MQKAGLINLIKHNLQQRVEVESGSQIHASEERGGHRSDAARGGGWKGGGRGGEGEGGDEGGGDEGGSEGRGRVREGMGEGFCCTGIPSWDDPKEKCEIAGSGWAARECCAIFSPASHHSVSPTFLPEKTTSTRSHLERVCTRNRSLARPAGVRCGFACSSRRRCCRRRETGLAPRTQTGSPQSA